MGTGLSVFANEFLDWFVLLGMHNSIKCSSSRGTSREDFSTLESFHQTIRAGQILP